MPRQSQAQHRYEEAGHGAGRRLTALGAVAALAFGSFVATSVLTTANAAGGGSSIGTTTNINFGSSPGDGACNNGPSGVDPINCNSYNAKEDVWLSGLPGPSADGVYYFAVLAPGGQSDPTDGSPKNLSDGTDGDQANRTFTVTNGVITTAGSNTVDAVHNKLQMFPFDDTTNNGGVYIAAVCPVGGGNCKYDAFKVKSSTPPPPPPPGLSAPSADKTAVSTHIRKVHWDIKKLVDGKSAETIEQAGPATLSYTVAVTKTVDFDTYGLTGTISVHNTNPVPLDVTVAETGLAPNLAGSNCTLTGSGSLTVPAKDLITLDPGTASVDYTCTFGTAPDESASYTNTATVMYDLGEGDGTQELDVASDLFSFPAATLVAGSAPDSITVSDPNAPVGAGFPKLNVSASTTFPYSQTVFNSNCVEYDNTATIVQTAQSSSTAVIFCGPNNGGLTQGWWQNKNGQALLKANLAAACTTVNGDLPAVFTHGALTYLPDAYTQNKSFPIATYQYVSANCTGPTNNKSYLPAFDVNVFSSANAAGTGTMMVESQWMTTAMDTANYTVSTSAGKPTLNAGQKVLIPSALQSGLGLAACDTIGNLLKASAAQYASYAASKASGVTPALIPLLDAINNNKAVTCI